LGPLAVAGFPGRLRVTPGAPTGWHGPNSGGLLLIDCLPRSRTRLDAVTSMADFEGSHQTGGWTMSASVDVAGGQLRAIVERIENIEEEIKELAEAKKEVYLEAKGNGFDVKIVREVIRVRKQDQKERDELETLLAIKGASSVAKKGASSAAKAA